MTYKLSFSLKGMRFIEDMRSPFDIEWRNSISLLSAMRHVKVDTEEMFRRPDTSNITIRPPIRIPSELHYLCPAGPSLNFDPWPLACIAIKQMRGLLLPHLIFLVPNIPNLNTNRSQTGNWTGGWTSIHVARSLKEMLQRFRERRYTHMRLCMTRLIQGSVAITQVALTGISGLVKWSRGWGVIICI